MKTILVTGGCGFVGSHLCRYLLARGDRVMVIDNLSTGSLENIQDIKDKLFFIEQDVVKSIGAYFDEIYNLACPASPKYYQKHPIETTKASVWGALSMLELARMTGARILQASTSEVYGDPLEHPQPETYNGNVNPIGIRSCYDEGKRMAESLFFDYHRKYGVNIRVARIFNTYGPNMAKDDGRVISNFINQAKEGKDITIHGGHQTRCFMYVDDLIKGLVTVMESDITGPVNLGRPEEHTIGDVARLVKLITASKSEFVYGGVPQDDPVRRKPDITLARSLGWEPKIDLYEGLQKLIDI